MGNLPRERRLRVAQVITRMVPGGASRVVLDLLRGAPDSIEMELFTGPEEMPSGLEEAVWPCPVHVVRSMRRSISPLRDLAAYRELAAAISQGRFDVVHAHTSKAGFLGRLAAARAGVGRAVYTAHGSIFLPGSRIPGVGSPITRRILLAAERHAGKRAQAYVALSRHEGEVAARLGLAAPDRIRVVPDGIDVGHFERSEEKRAALRSRWGISPGDLLVLAAGRLSPEKGHRYLLDAVAALRPRFPAIRVAVCGEGPLARELEAAARARGLEAIAAFPGFQQDIAPALWAADIFAHPSLYEGFGLAPLEAMASGLPVAATAVGGLPELIRHGEEGFLVPPGDGPALAGALARLLGSPALRAVMGRKARGRARAFSRERMVATYAAIYRGDRDPGAAGHRAPVRTRTVEDAVP